MPCPVGAELFLKSTMHVPLALVLPAATSAASTLLTAVLVSRLLDIFRLANVAETVPEKPLNLLVSKRGLTKLTHDDKSKVPLN